MDFGKLYEGIFLRDLMEYLVPGLVFFGAAFILCESSDYNYFYSVFQNTNTSDFPSTLLLLLAAYVLGHLITGFNSILRRKNEDQFTIDALKSKHPGQNNPPQDNWFISQVEFAASNFLNVPLDEAKQVLGNENSFASFREICRLYVQHQLPTPYREFVLRHSVFSRSFQNMFVALIFLWISLVVNFLVSFFRPSDWYVRCDVPSALIYVFLLGLLSGSIWVCWKRPDALRKKMMIHTFQIWHTHLTQLSEQAIQARTLRQSAIPTGGSTSQVSGLTAP